MKIFRPLNNEKSWSIKLIDWSNPDQSRFRLLAVDSTTGKQIAVILQTQEGKCIMCCKVREMLKNHDYDPNEHGNKWDTEGRLITEKE